MKEIHLFGCSFTLRVEMIQDVFDDKFEYFNHGEDSANNSLIYNTFVENATENSVCIVQWSSLTRPMDENFSLLESSDNPLFDLLEQWYPLVEQTKQIAEEKNITLLQFVGWATWKDSELNDYHREKLNSLGIQWFTSSAQNDLIDANCFQFELPHLWSSSENEEGLFYWDELTWGGISEWVRENIDINDRYDTMPEELRNGGPLYDPHPSATAMRKFVEQVVLPQITT